MLSSYVGGCPAQIIQINIHSLRDGWRSLSVENVSVLRAQRIETKGSVLTCLKRSDVWNLCYVFLFSLITEITAKTSTNNRKKFTHSHHSPVLTPISSPHHTPANSSHSTHSVSILASSLVCEQAPGEIRNQFGELETEEIGERSNRVGTGERVDFVFDVPVCP